MCIILSNSKRGQTPMLISYTMKEALCILSHHKILVPIGLDVNVILIRH